MSTSAPNTDKAMTKEEFLEWAINEKRKHKGKSTETNALDAQMIVLRRTEQITREEYTRYEQT